MEERNDVTNSTPPIPRALVDTNVVLDLVLAREPWATQAKAMWAARDAGRIEMYLPASALTDIYYIARKPIGNAQALAAIQVCLRRFVILLVDRAIIEAALTLPGADFEDNVQIACAQAAGLDLIVTRNVGDFAQAGIPAIPPPDVPTRLGR